MATIKLFKLTDLGNALKATGEPVSDTEGLDGTVLKHLGWEGYPDLSGATVLFVEEVKPYCLVIYEGEIAGGQVIASNQLVLTLVELFGWPENATTLDEGGLPATIVVQSGGRLVV